MMERSLWSAHHVFAENLARKNLMAKSECAVLTEWFNFLTTASKIEVGVDLVIYLKTSPEVALERLRKRQRSKEEVNSVSRDYVKVSPD